MTTRELVSQYVEVLCKIYGKHLKTVILYGSYARGDYTKDSDIDIMVLLDLSDIDIKKYRHELSGATYIEPNLALCLFHYAASNNFTPSLATFE